MKIKLFPERFLRHERCFDLFRTDADGELDFPLSIECDERMPCHIVHSDPSYLAYLVGLIILQAWTMGIDELEVPLFERKPILVVTDKPGRFSEAYLSLMLPLGSIKKFSRRRRVTLYEKTGKVPNADLDKSSYWDMNIRTDEDRLRLHNYFPAHLIFRTDGVAQPISDRQYLGRGDDAAPALLITRRVDKGSLHALLERHNPILTIFDAHCMIASANGLDTPALVYHESIFSPELAQAADEGLVCYCLPDNRFEYFCSQTRLNILEPEESPKLMAIWNDIDGAIQALTELVDQRSDRVVMEVYRAAIRLRGILLSLPVTIQLYESMLQMTDQTENYHYLFSVTRLWHFMPPPPVGPV